MGCLQRRARSALWVGAVLRGGHAALPTDQEEDRPSWGLKGTHPGLQGLQSSVWLSDLGVRTKLGHLPACSFLGAAGLGGTGRPVPGSVCPRSCRPSRALCPLRGPGEQEGRAQPVMGRRPGPGGRVRVAAGAWPPADTGVPGTTCARRAGGLASVPPLQRDSRPARGQRLTAEGQPLWAEGQWGLPRSLCAVRGWPWPGGCRLQGRVRLPGAQAAGCTGMREHFPCPFSSRGDCPALAATAGSSDSTLGPNLASSPDSSAPCGGSQHGLDWGPDWGPGCCRRRGP